MNRLAQETSPYLLQHQNNPVDWYSWCDEALQRSQTEDKPIFLSIGYSACHWCHVMEHESFEDASIAAFLNQHFVCIKVDREERPDLDHIYMQAVQMMTGRGGWPLSAFLTPDLQPFYGGTYWPPTARMGMPGFDEVLRAIINAWTERREQAVQQAAQLTAAINNVHSDATEQRAISPDLLSNATSRLATLFDSVNGGFGRAPKFPRPIELQMLLRSWHRDGNTKTLDMIYLTLDKMAAGGMYDHLAGGFARYSVDDHWLVPHFEKMLYDNALLADAYLDAHLVTRHPYYAEVVSETLDYIQRDMVDPQHGFHSTEDADSEGEEGKYYVWTVDEIQQHLAPELADTFCQIYDVTSRGNFEGKNILNLAVPIEQVASAMKCEPDDLAQQMRDARQVLLEQRGKRIRPGKDDKVLVSWNALMIHTMARAAGVLQRPDYLTTAQQAATFLHTQLRRDDDRLLHCWRQGTAKLDAYLDDYTYLANAFVTLYESDFDEHWIDMASELCDFVLRHFRDEQQGGFFFTADDHERLAARTKEWHDASVPSSNAMAATAMLRLGKLTGRSDLLGAASDTLEAAKQLMWSTPEAASQMLIAADLQLGPTSELVVCGQPGAETDQILHALRTHFVPRKVLAYRSPAHDTYRSPLLNPLFDGKPESPDQPTLYVCESFSCQEPMSGSERILKWLAENAHH